MPAKPVTDRACPDPDCTLYRQFRKGNIIRHSFIRLRRGRRRRYLCKACGKTFCSSTATPYHRLHYSRRTFAEVVRMSVEGVCKAAIARIKGLSWNTVARWIESVAAHARRFKHLWTRGYELRELQADEIRTFTDGKKRVVWVLVTIEVWSRLWPSTAVGRRSYRNTRRLITDTARRGRFDDPPLLTTDGFKYYEPVIVRLFGDACVHGQVMKTYRNNRVNKVERKLLIGSKQQLTEALWRSEDSSSLNTSFVERLNLTIRQGSAYLGRRTPSHARSREHLEGHLELLRCYYNFVRPHRALKYGRDVWTPAMQAGLASRKLSFRDVFTFVPGLAVFVLVVIRLLHRCGRTGSGRMVA